MISTNNKLPIFADKPIISLANSEPANKDMRRVKLVES